MDLGLSGKIALVTGGARGLGRAIVMGLANEGADLVVADLADTDRIVREVGALGRKCLAVRADIADQDQVRDLFQRIEEEFKGLDILVNNAGISQLDYRPTIDMPVEEWDKVIRVNLTGAFLCCRQAGRMMIKGGGGSIVNISSTVGLTGVPRAPAYCASKAGLNLLTKSLALEWAADKIRVNAIAPHYLETEMSRTLRDSEKVYQGLIRQIPLKRFGQTWEAVGAVLFLASGAATYITGEILAVDGGYLAK
jgi:NAD(P)-dependent dehydrogenase (short-subunit alcohol dehydrogenase family)